MRDMVSVTLVLGAAELVCWNPCNAARHIHTLSPHVPLPPASITATYGARVVKMLVLAVVPRARDDIPHRVLA